MSDYTGRKVAIGLAIEETRGTAEAAPQIWLPHLDQDFTDKQEKVLNESALGVLDTNNDAILVKQWAEGKIDGKVMSNAFGYILLAAFGLVASDDGTAVGTFDHTFTTNNDNESPTLTIFKSTPNEELAYALSVLNSLEIEIVVGEYVKYSASFISKKGTSVSVTPAYSIETEHEFTAKHLNLYIGNYGTAFATIKAGSAYPVKSLKITLERSAEPYFETGTDTPTEIHNKAFNCSIEVEKRYSDLTFKTLAQGDTKKAIVIEVVNEDQTIGTGGHPALEFDLPKIIVNEHEPSEGLEDIAEESFTLQGLFDTVSGKQIQAILTNIVEEYVFA